MVFYFGCLQIQHVFDVSVPLKPQTAVTNSTLMTLQDLLIVLQLFHHLRHESYTHDFKSFSLIIILIYCCSTCTIRHSSLFMKRNHAHVRRGRKWEMTTFIYDNCLHVCDKKFLHIYYLQGYKVLVLIINKQK